MVPTRAATLGVKGHRPTVGTRDGKDLLYVFAVVNLVTAAVQANTLESPKDAKKKTGKSKSRRFQEAFVKHLEGVAKAYPAERNPSNSSRCPASSRVGLEKAIFTRAVLRSARRRGPAQPTGTRLPAGRWS